MNTIKTALPSREGEVEYALAEDLRLCPLNPRKRVDEAGILEMAESLLAGAETTPTGIQEPVCCRRVEGVDGSLVLEVVWGQRRWLGAQRARTLGEERGLGDAWLEEHAVGWVPYFLREIGDHEVVVEGLVENLVREAMDPWDEGEALKRCLALEDDSGKRLFSPISLAGRLGKSDHWVRARVACLEAPTLLWDAYRQGLVGLKHFDWCALIPDAGMRELYAERVVRPKHGREPLSLEAARTLLEAEFIRPLRGQGFDLEDEDLVPVAHDAAGTRLSGGGCEDCPHRSGNRVKSRGEGAWRCLNVACLDAKRQAMWERLAALAREDGRRVCTADEAEMWFGDGERLSPAAPVVSLSGHPGYRETGHYDGERLPVWEALLEGTTATAEAWLCRAPKGSIHFLLPRDRALTLAEGAGHAELFRERPTAKRSRSRQGSERPQGERRQPESQACDDEETDGKDEGADPLSGEVDEEARRLYELAEAVVAGRVPVAALLRRMVDGMVGYYLEPWLLRYLGFAPGRLPEAEEVVREIAAQCEVSKERAAAVLLVICGSAGVLDDEFWEG